MASVGISRGVAHQGPPPLPHIDDITAVPKDIDRNMSLKHLLEICEAALRSAETSREFGRPAFALKDYLRASIIAVHVVQNHRDYPTLQSNRSSDLFKKHSALLKKIKALWDTYESVKADIKRDNLSSGIKPTTSRPGVFDSPISFRTKVLADSSSLNGDDFNAAHTNGPPSNAQGGSPSGKPVPRPKPQSLHGNTLQNNHARSQSLSSSSANDSLATRFAGLRGPQAHAGQDPRIKTHSFTPPPQPKGPREMPANQKPKLGLNSSVPSLPKMPDAIYSPVRGNMSEESARMPTSTPRGQFSRTGSSVSISGTPSASSQPPSKDYFSPTYTNTISADPGLIKRPSVDASSTVSSPRRSLDLPPKNTIEAQELYRVMKEKATFLIIDIRPRDEFDDGHIMSTSTICVEQSILARDNITADDIAESLIISPNQDQNLFEKRQEYDLIVICDQDSEDIPKIARGPEDKAIISLHRALVHLSYKHELRQPPRLLKGGINAWVDLLGPGSLQATSSSSLKTSQMHRDALARRRSKYVVKQMKPDDVKAFQDAVKNDDMETASSPNLYRSTEDFIRRYPAVPTEPEDMTAPVPPPKPQKPLGYQPAHHQHGVGDLPAPLARPAPAVSRHSHSGLSVGADLQDRLNDKSSSIQQVSARGQRGSDASVADLSRSYTGLNNPHNWCYANSILQSLLACEFGKELISDEWRKNWIVPRKQGETIDQPQLMMQILANLFHWMATGKFEVMKASTLMSYSRHVSLQTGSYETFGDNNQHDAQEFMAFLLTHLDDETNRRRNLVRDLANPDQPRTQDQSLLQAAIDFWKAHIHTHESIVDKYWRLLELSTTICHDCGTSSYKFSTADMISPSIGNSDTTLEQALVNHVQPNKLDDYKCDNCDRIDRERNRKSRGHTAITYLSYPRMPPLLCITLNRFGYSYSKGAPSKSDARITWDLNDFDMTRFFLKPEQCHLKYDVTDKAFKGRHGYECFAVVEHSGSSANSGHYTAYIRDPRTHDPSAWLYCNDSNITKVRMDNPTERAKVFKQSQRVPYLAFFRKKFDS